MVNKEINDTNISLGTIYTSFFPKPCHKTPDIILFGNQLQKHGCGDYQLKINVFNWKM